MATYVNDLRLKEIATGDESGTWGTSTNTNLELIGEAFSFGTEAISTNADTHTTTIADGSTDPGRSIYLQYTGALDSTCTITIGPNTVSKLWFIENATSGSQSIIIKQGSGATVTIRNGDVKAIYSDGAGSGGKMVDAFTDLHVNGLISEVDGNTSAITLRSTDADENLGPLLTFDRLSGSPADGDLTGKINFTARNDASEQTVFASMQSAIVDASDGTEDGSLQINTKLAGTARSRLFMDATETVFNDGSQDLDFRVETNGAANKFFVDGGNNVVLIGANAPVSTISVASTFQIQGNSNANSGMSITRYTNNDSAPYVTLAKSRSTSVGDNFTIVQDGDTVGRIGFVAADGVDMSHQAAKIAANIDGTPGENDLPGRLGFFITADGASATTERMRITKSGDIGIGNTAPSTRLHVTTATQDDGITIECTNGGTAAGPSLKLDRSSSGPADSDVIGEIEFSGRNDASQAVLYARMSSTILDASDGTEDGSINLTAILDGTDRSRFFSNSTETVINEGSQNLDFRVESNGNTGMLMVDGGDNAVLIGTVTSRADVGSSTAAALQMEGTSGASSRFAFTRNQANTGGPNISLGKSRSTSLGSVTVVQSGDNLGSLTFHGADGTDIATPAAQILALVDGTPGSNDMPGRMTFSTTPDGSDSLSEVMRIKQSGAVIINSTTDYGGKLNVVRGDNNTTLALVCTDADAADGPILDFIRDSSSPATTDDIAVINFKADDSDGNRDTYAQIEVFSTNVTSGSEAGRMDFKTRLSGTNVSRLKFTSAETSFNEDGSNLDFRVESQSSTKMFFIDAALERIRIGNATHKQAGGTAKMVAMAANDGSSGMAIVRHTASSGAGSVSFGKSRATADSDVTIVQDGDSLGSIGFSGADGTDIVSTAASINAEVDGTPGSNDMPGRLVFSTTDDGAASPSERMRIDSNGCVMINRTTAVADDMTAAALHVGTNATTTSPTMIVDDGDSSVESGSICMAVMFSNDNSFSGGKYISFRDLGGEQGSVSGDGTGSVAYNTSSDMRLKTNIQDTASQWDTIKALQVRDYEWIGNGNEETGFIAQEIHEQIPQVVYVGGEEAAKEPWAVDYGRITPQLTKALQEAMARIETLESELAKLKGGS